MYARFFAFISLFAFGMLTLVVSDNLLLLFVGWEIMGLCSYLLIGFWFGKDSAKKAMVKAFMTTRVGDVFMLLGLAYLYSATGTLNYREILANEEVLHHLATTPAFLGLSIAGADAASCSSSARSASRRSSRCTSGCRTRWKARRRSRP